MVQIVEGRPSGISQFIQSAQPGIDALEQHFQRRRGEKERESEDIALKEKGIDVTGVRDPKLRAMLLEGKLEEGKKVAKDLQTQQEMSTVKGLLGEEAAELWPLLTEGAKTDFFEKIFKEREREVGLKEAVAKYVAENPDSFKSDEIVEAGVKAPTKRPKPMDFDKGLTADERFKRQEKRYEKNLPLYQDVQQKLQASEEETDLINRLVDLNETKRLPSTLGRININPVTGDILFPALASPEAQLYAKTVNEFGRKAKDTYGTRVTNFEFDRFLKRLPTLANTEEGRRIILEQMDYFNQINNVYNQELEEIVEEHGGIRKIDWDEAEREARKRSKGKIKPLKEKFNSSWKQAQELYNYETKKKQEQLPAGFVLMYDEEGNELHVPKNEVNSVKKLGARLALEE